MELENFAEIRYKFYRKVGEIQNVAWFVSRHGQVITKNYRKRTIKPTTRAKGDCKNCRVRRPYVIVQTTAKNKKKHHEHLHRIVAKIFVTGYQKGLEVDHLNGYKWDNRAENLEWVTPRENSRRYFQTDDAKRANELHSKTLKKMWAEKKQQARTE